MEFGEKLQQLRKSGGLTQEELAQALYVPRTAASKWESGRGYPSIDSLKELSAFFHASVDELLPGERILAIARQESGSGVRALSGRLFATADMLAVLLDSVSAVPQAGGRVCQRRESAVLRRDCPSYAFMLLTMTTPCSAIETTWLGHTVLFQLLLTALIMLIRYPFVKMLDRQYLAQEGDGSCAADDDALSDVLCRYLCA